MAEKEKKTIQFGENPEEGTNDFEALFELGGDGVETDFREGKENGGEAGGAVAPVGSEVVPELKVEQDGAGDDGPAGRVRHAGRPRKGAGLADGEPVRDARRNMGSGRDAGVEKDPGTAVGSYHLSVYVSKEFVSKLRIVSASKDMSLGGYALSILLPRVEEEYSLLNEEDRNVVENYLKLISRGK